MLQRNPVARVSTIGAWGTATLLFATPGIGAHGAKKRPAACTATYKAATEREQSGHLREASKLWLACAKEACGSLMGQCSSRYAELEFDTPTVIPLVTNERGQPLVDVQVTFDGQPLIERLDGRGVPVDPGLHEFAFYIGGEVVALERIMVAEGQRNRTIAVSTGPAAARDPQAQAPAAARSEPPPADTRSEVDKPGPGLSTSGPTLAPPEPRRKGGAPALAYLLGGAGIASLGSAGLLTYWGSKDNSALAQCTPNCRSSSVDHIRELYIAADISFGVGVAALGFSTWLFLKPHSKEEPPAPQTSYTFDVRPTRSGAFATVSRSF